ncbi:MAG TPA: DJ-1/PfpI family protein [Steroidobacteraceae bacterium]|nr:DJ-1/PfpI family protein [Steroidobacteraceae bacterium]
MHRRQFINTTLAATVALFGPGLAQAATGGTPAPLPKRARIRVAFMLGDNANVIDTAGPWEVFQDVMLDGAGHSHPFELYTVAPEAKLLRMTGGLQVQPHYGVRDAPQPQVIVVPAHRSTDESRAWLRAASAGTDVTMSVCTGAFQLARAGLLKGIPATTHHQFFDSFAKEFPDVELRRGLRFVDSGRIATAGGLTSGIDMALHVVARYFGTEVAAATAAYMEYTSDAWRA